jgi:hypothetical protein
VLVGLPQRQDAHALAVLVFLRVRPSATVVFRTSGLLRRRGRTCSASR